jgi:proline racemase
VAIIRNDTRAPSRVTQWKLESPAGLAEIALNCQPGNVHSAADWRDVLELVVARYRNGM